MSFVRAATYLRLSQRVYASSASALVAAPLVGPVSGTRMVFTAVGMAPDNIKEGKVLHPDLMNPAILKAEYAVRGELYNRAMELAAQGREIIYTNGTWAEWDYICDVELGVHFGSSGMQFGMEMH